MHSLKSFYTRIRAACLCLMLAALLCAGPTVFAQETESTDKAGAPTVFQARVSAANAVTLIAAGRKPVPVHLWGLQRIEDVDPLFRLRARLALDNQINGKPVECELRQTVGDEIFATCDAERTDLGLFMIQQGFVTVDRSRVIGSVFEQVYIEAEQQAQDRKLGIWGYAGPGGTKGRADDGSVLMNLAFVLFVFMIAAFAALSVIIMRGFQKVIESQNRAIDMSIQQTRMRQKEREIVVMMFDSELKANKSRIEAYLVVYEEILKSLNDPNRVPKYRRSGDIVQQQPALERTVFEKNADKLEILGQELAFDLIQFYSHVKPNPDYINLEPDTELEDAVKIVEEAVNYAGQLNKGAEDLLIMLDNRMLAFEASSNQSKKPS